MGASCAGSYEVTPPAARVRNDTTHRVDGSRQGQQIHVRHTEGQTQRAVPGTSSLAYGEQARAGSTGDGTPWSSPRGFRFMATGLGGRGPVSDRRLPFLIWTRWQERRRGSQAAWRLTLLPSRANQAAPRIALTRTAKGECPRRSRAVPVAPW